MTLSSDSRDRGQAAPTQTFSSWTPPQNPPQAQAHRRRRHHRPPPHWPVPAPKYPSCSSVGRARESKTMGMATGCDAPSPTPSCALPQIHARTHARTCANTQHLVLLRNGLEMVEVVGAQLVDDAREKVLQVETRHAHQWATNASMHVIHVSLRPEPSGTLSTNGEDFELATSELSESNASRTVTTS